MKDEDGSFHSHSTEVTALRRALLLLTALAVAAGVDASQGRFFTLHPSSFILHQQPSDQPVFRSATHVVEVDVVVRDRAGRFVADLEIEDFEVTEDGRPQRSFSLHLVTPSGIRSAPARSDRPSPPRTASSTIPRRTVVIVFDLEHLSAGALSRLKSAVSGFVSERVRQIDLVGIVADGRMLNDRLSGDRTELTRSVQGLRARADRRSRLIDLQDWPRLTSELEALEIAGDRDPGLLEHVLARACRESPELCSGGPGAGRLIESSSGTVTASSDKEPGGPVGASAREDVRAAIKQKARRITADLTAASSRMLSTLTSLTRGLRDLEGRKTVIVLSEGAFSGDSLIEFQGVVGEAARAGVRMYAVDARGLDRANRDLLEQRDAADLGVLPHTGFDLFADGLNVLAVDTGGYVVRNTNNLRRALDDIADDASRYYVLGYAPDDQRLDGRFRRLDVKVGRSGVVVRARRGYLATPSGPVKAIEPDRPVLDAMALAGSEVGLAAPVEPAVLPITASARTSGEGVTILPDGDEGLVGGIATRLRPGGSQHVMDLAGPVSAADGSAPTGTDGRGAATASVSGESWEALAREGWSMYERGRPGQAAGYLARAAANPAAAPWVRYAWGLSEYASFRFREAAAAWEHVVNVAADFQPVYFDLTDAYLQLNELDKAITLLRRAEARWAADPEVLNALGVIQVRRGALDDAIVTFRKAVESAPETGLGHYNLARAHHLRYVRSRRWARHSRSWAANEDDRLRAIEGYERYLEHAGPFTQSAREALEALRSGMGVR